MIIFLLELFFYVLPLLLIAYALYLMSETRNPWSKGFIFKMALYIIPSMVLIHFAFLFSGAVKAGDTERSKLRSGTYINATLGDTVKLTGDSVYVLYAHKKKKPAADQSTFLDTGKKDSMIVTEQKKKKRSKSLPKKNVVHFDLNEDVASTYSFARDTIVMFSKNWDKKKTMENIDHLLKKLPLSGDVTDEILIKDEGSDKTKLKYHFALHHDTLTLNNSKNKDLQIQYIKQYPAKNGKPAAAK